jgi:hypothetical protein
MKAIIKLERIGEIPRMNRLIMGGGPRMPWVAEVTRPDPRRGLHRKFLQFEKDFSCANSQGSRGVFAVYVLQSGKVYEVFERTSWTGSARYFVTINDGGQVEQLPSISDAFTKIEHNQIDDNIRSF